MDAARPQSTPPTDDRGTAACDDAPPACSERWVSWHTTSAGIAQRPMKAACVSAGPSSEPPWAPATEADVSSAPRGMPLCAIVSGDFDADGQGGHALLEVNRSARLRLRLRLVLGGREDLDGGSGVAGWAAVFVPAVPAFWPACLARQHGRRGGSASQWARCSRGVSGRCDVPCGRRWAGCLLLLWVLVGRRRRAVSAGCL